MRIRFFDIKLWLVVFVLAVGLMLAGRYGKTITGPSHIPDEEGTYQYPYEDCGFNFFMFVRLPGDVCVTRITDAEKVESEMERQEPDFWKKPFEQVTGRFDEVLMKALKALGWDLP